MALMSRRQEGLGAGQTIPRHRTHTHTHAHTSPLTHMERSSGAKRTAKGKRRGGEAHATAIRITKRPGKRRAEGWGRGRERGKSELQTDRKPNPNEQQLMHYEKGRTGIQSQSASNLQNKSFSQLRKWWKTALVILIIIVII